MEKNGGRISSSLDMNMGWGKNPKELLNSDFAESSATPVQKGNEDGRDVAFKMPSKRRRRQGRRTRHRRPGNRKRKYLGWNIIPRSSLGAPFLCNDMLMAKDGWVFDKRSGRIEFKPEVVPVSHEEGESSTASCNRYIPISPERDSSNAQSTCFHYEYDCHFHDDIGHPPSNSPPLTNCDSGFASPSQQDLNTSSISMNDSLSSPTLQSHDQSLSVLCDSDKDFKFHMQNFEEDTDQYLRECLMELPREDLEVQYHSTVQKLRSLESGTSCMDPNNNLALQNPVTALNCSPTSSFSTGMYPDLLTEGIETLQELTSKVVRQFHQLQQENAQLKQENHRIQLTLDT